MMITAQKISMIYDILGLKKGDLRAFACAVLEAERLLFEERVPMDDIRVTRDLYPRVAEQLGKDPRSAARQLERAGNCCWSCMDEAQKEKYIGKALKDIRAPRDMIFYLAFYAHFQKGFYQVLEECPELLFHFREAEV